MIISGQKLPAVSYSLPFSPTCTHGKQLMNGGSGRATWGPSWTSFHGHHRAVKQPQPLLSRALRQEHLQKQEGDVQRLFPPALSVPFCLKRSSVSTDHKDDHGRTTAAEYTTAPQAERGHFCPRSSGTDLDFGPEAGKWTGWHTSRGFFSYWRTVF